MLYFMGFLALSCSLALASDPSPLQDFCVAAPSGQVFVNGQFCKDPKHVTENDSSVASTSPETVPTHLVPR
ncbi:Germin-like protein subfamily 1 member 11 [Acorus gramineus]|uniref:Germin-like protein subfamily 1 member 11 n=1 Tax=Acorus gramineus TaxID=55184 RepID=A0AAV9BXF0_ACOGR|nr:Germin-like protein subfamily 1 member 11 [Acorus gramineus]